MKTTTRNGLLTGSIIIFLLLSPGAWAAIKRYQLSHADHASILAGCRDAMSKRTLYRNDKAKWSTAEPNEVVISCPIPDNIPEGIRNLHPSLILIKADHVIINFTAPFAR